MKDITCTIEGVTPLLCNRFTDAAMDAATSGNRISTVGDRGTPREIAQSKLYAGHDGRPMIPQPNLFRAIIDGGTFFKAGKSKVTTLKTSIVPACLSIAEIEIPIEHREPWTIDTRAVRIPSTGGRISTHRPCFHDWRLTFSLQLDETMMGAKLLREIIDASGKRIGLGDFRPACKGPFGKFVVVEWREEVSAFPQAA
jgi:hypothetical protein